MDLESRREWITSKPPPKITGLFVSWPDLASSIKFFGMVSEKDHARMRLIAEAMDETNAEAVLKAAQQSPGDNIETGLRLGDVALLLAQHAVPRPDAVAPSRLWRELKRKKALG